MITLLLELTGIKSSPVRIVIQMITMPKLFMVTGFMCVGCMG